MALLGQASGAFTESSSSLRILHVGIRNTVGVITDEAFEQTNPPLYTADSAATSTISEQVATTIFGVLSGSVAFTRADIDENVIGGPAGSVGALVAQSRPLGIFINHAAGYGFENTPAAASNKCPYVSAQGCYANSLFEDKTLGLNGAGVLGAGAVGLTYVAGDVLVASVNGYLTKTDDDGYELNASAGATSNTIIGIVKMAPDNTQFELVYDQRI